MRIKIINPDYGLFQADWIKREKYLKQAVSDSTVIYMSSPQNNNIYVDSSLDAALASAEIIQIGQQAYQDGFEGIGLYCFSDPALEALRELVSIPVIGAGQASMNIASLLGQSISVITTAAKRIPQKRIAIKAMGIESDRIASIRGLDFHSEKHEAMLEKLLTVSKKCIVEDHAEVIVLGCLAYTWYAEELTERLKIPVVDPAFTLVGLLELLGHQKLSHSKITYPFPEMKKRQWSSGVIN